MNQTPEFGSWLAGLSDGEALVDLRPVDVQQSLIEVESW